MNVDVVVTAQIFENYNWDDLSNPHWKPKGGQEFVLPVDADTIMYTPDWELVGAIKAIISQFSDDKFKYEYRDHEVRFSKPVVLEGLDALLEQ